MTKKLTPINQCDSLPNVGGFLRLRLAYSKDIIQQELQSDTEIPQIIFASAEKWIADYEINDYFTADLKIEESLADSGSVENYSFKTVHEVDADRVAFRLWYDKNIRNRRFALEISKINDLTICVNPFLITYTYLGKGQFADKYRYELSFTRTKLINNNNHTIKIIDKITSVAKLYVGIASNDVTINVFDNITSSLFNFGYSITNDINTVTYQNDPTNNVLINLVDGSYFFFAVHRSSALYDVVKATITAGDITIILSDYNNQIITENETETFEGDFVAQ